MLQMSGEAGGLWGPRPEQPGKQKASPHLKKVPYICVRTLGSPFCLLNPVLVRNSWRQRPFDYGSREPSLGLRPVLHVALRLCSTHRVQREKSGLRISVYPCLLICPWHSVSLPWLLPCALWHKETHVNSCSRVLPLGLGPFPVNLLPYLESALSHECCFPASHPYPGQSQRWRMRTVITGTLVSPPFTRPSVLKLL